MTLKNSLNKDDTTPYSNAFSVSVEDLLPKLRDEANLVPITGEQISRNVGDFYGLLKDLKIDRRYWWPTLRLNGLTSPYMYKGERREIFTLNSAVMDKVMRNS